MYERRGWALCPGVAGGVPPGIRLGWIFRDREANITPYSEPPPDPKRGSAPAGVTPEEFVACTIRGVWGVIP